MEQKERKEGRRKKEEEKRRGSKSVHVSRGSLLSREEVLPTPRFSPLQATHVLPTTASS